MTRLIALVSPPAHTNRTPEENLGLEYLASESIENGHKVDYIDAWIEQLSVDTVVKMILNKQYEVIGISPSMDSFVQVKQIVRSLKKKNYTGKIILGGIYATFQAKDIMEEIGDCIEGVLTGEADETFQDFLRTIDIRSISGAIFKNKQGLVTTNNKNRAVQSLDKLPFPLRATFAQVRSIKTPSHVMGSRGCRGNCSFCSIACYQKFSSDKKWRGRSPDNIVKEMVELANMGETMVKFVDDNFFEKRTDKSREFEIARLIKKEKINMRFRVSLRVDDVEEDIISKLAECGLFAVSLGVESFVPRKLIDFAKGISVDQIYKSLNILKKNKIYVQMGHIMFDPFVTIDEIRQELYFLEKYKWTVTKGVCTRLFAADGTLITQKIADSIGFVGKEGANNIYEIKQSQAENFYQGLRVWAGGLNSLYEQVIDPISAPKNVDSSLLEKFHLLSINLRSLDIDVSKKILSCVDDRHKAIKMGHDMLLKYEHQINGIKQKVNKLYDVAKLDFYRSQNIRI